MDIIIKESKLETNQANFVQWVITGLRAADAMDGDDDQSANLIQVMENSATCSKVSQQQLAAQLQEVT
jgi:hypothetical protein